MWSSKFNTLDPGTIETVRFLLNYKAKSNTAPLGQYTLDYDSCSPPTMCSLIRFPEVSNQNNGCVTTLLTLRAVK